MLLVNISRNDRYPLVDQIVDGIRLQIDARELRTGSRLPSIRAFATEHGISRFTVVEAYDRLVAMGYLRSRRGAGFFVVNPDTGPVRPDVPPDHQRNEQMVWLVRRLLEARGDACLVGGPWLPNEWLEESGIRRAIRGLAARQNGHMLDYGDSFGYLPLREQIAQTVLPEIGLRVRPEQILLTTGASQALDLVIRRLLAPGDAVLVDDPGYYNMFGNLRLNGIRLVGVPRGVDGPDVDALDRLAAEHRPKLYFTQSVLQNPTGTTMTPHVVFRVLQAAEKYGFRVVEDDIFSDLHPDATPRLAALDQLASVIYVRSFSKTLSGSLRVGFIACDTATAFELVDAKMVTCITSSQFNEVLIHQLLVGGQYRKFVGRLRERIGRARCNVVRAFDEIGLELFCDPGNGMFLWSRFAGIDNSAALAERAMEQGLVLAPGTVFRPNLQPSPWMRFNVTVCDDRSVLDRLARLRD